MPKKTTISYAPVNLDTGKTYKNPYYPIYPQFPFQLQIYGATNTGKSNTLLSLFVYHPHTPIDYTIWVANPHSLQQSKIKDAQKRLKKKFVVVEGLDEELIDELIDEHRGKQIMVVFDDLLNENKRDKKILNDLYIGGRHRGVAVAELSQSVFSDGALVRRENSNTYIITKMNDNNGLKRLFNRLFGSNADNVLKAYEVCLIGHGKGAFFMIQNDVMTESDPEFHKYQLKCNSLNNIVLGVLD